MKERPVLFSATMVRAILDGRKTQTRRIIKPQPYIDEMGNFCWNGENFGQDFNGPCIQAIASPIPSSKTKRVRCPYGKPGDRLWVRETHWMDKRDILCAVMDLDGFAVDAHPAGRNKFVKDFDSLKNNKFWKKRPSIHMPRIASRILLEITGVRVERLQDISECDAKAEGSYVCDYFGRRLLDQSSNQGCYKWGYRSIWESLNGTGSWDLNPFVWVIEFKLLEVRK